jgi:hypothetical protein
MKNGGRQIAVVFSFFALISAAGSASATTILSGDGTETCLQGITLGGGSCTVQAINPHPVWQANNPNGSDAVWVSLADTGSPGTISPPSSTTDHIMRISETFFAAIGTTLALEVWADDTARVLIDGNEVFAPNFSQGTCAIGPIGCEPGEQGVIGHTFTVAGLHTVAFEAFQTGGGPFGLLYAGATRTVPEPSTWWLAVTALVLCLAWQRRCVRFAAPFLEAMMSGSSPAIDKKPGPMY